MREKIRMVLYVIILTCIANIALCVCFFSSYYKTRDKYERILNQYITSEEDVLRLSNAIYRIQSQTLAAVIAEGDIRPTLIEKEISQLDSSVRATFTRHAASLIDEDEKGLFHKVYSGYIGYMSQQKNLFDINVQASSHNTANYYVNVVMAKRLGEIDRDLEAINDYVREKIALIRVELRSANHVANITMVVVCALMVALPAALLVIFHHFSDNIIDSFSAEQAGRKKVLSTLARFTNEGVARSIAQGEIDFAPHLKDLTIFFSDIRGFTEISNSFKEKYGDESPKEIIEFLSDYMARMVNCITLSGGNVDKFEGDAIMGLWGIMRDDSLAFENMDDENPWKESMSQIHKSHVRDDALSAVKAAVAMRYALMKYNKDAAATGKPHISIGCGINTGRVTAGILGSEMKMEYTAIGDAVNLASRAESSNKLCGTDILITEDTYLALRDDFIRCKENSHHLTEEHKADEVVVEAIPVMFKVKGKGEQRFYGVVNMPCFDIAAFFGRGNGFAVDVDCARAVGERGPKTLAELRTLLDRPTPSFVNRAVNTDDKKVDFGK